MKQENDQLKNGYSALNQGYVNEYENRVKSQSAQAQKLYEEATEAGDSKMQAEILKIMSDWLVKKGIKRSDAQKYITSLFLALSEDAVVNSKKELKNLVKESQTPKGLNEQGLKEMNKKGVYKSVINTLNSIHKRLNN